MRLQTKELSLISQILAQPASVAADTRPSPIGLTLLLAFEYQGDPIVAGCSFSSAFVVDYLEASITLAEPDRAALRAQLDSLSILVLLAINTQCDSAP